MNLHAIKWLILFVISSIFFVGYIFYHIKDNARNKYIDVVVPQTFFLNVIILDLIVFFTFIAFLVSVFK